MTTLPARLCRWALSALVAAPALLFLPASHAAEAPLALGFGDFFVQPIGARGLTPTPQLLAAVGREVRLVGFMVHGPLMEAAASGLPSVATSFSAHSEYVKEHSWPSALRIDQGNLEPANDGIFFFGDRGDWKVPLRENIGAAIKKCLEAYQTPLWAEWSRHCRAAVEPFTWDAAAKHMIDAIARIG